MKGRRPLLSSDPGGLSQLPLRGARRYSNARQASPEPAATQTKSAERDFLRAFFSGCVIEQGHAFESPSRALPREREVNLPRAIAIFRRRLARARGRLRASSLGEFARKK